MYMSLRRTYYWPGMALDCFNVVRNCVPCCKRRVTLKRHTSFLKLFPAKRPGEHVAIDILGPLPKTRNGFIYLLVITDRFSKLTKVIPLRSISSYVVAKAFCDEWVFNYGQPAFLLSDRGTQFTARFFNTVCDILGIRQAFTSAYHPQTNGQTERFNRTILASLRCFCSEHGRDWDQFARAVAYGYNNTVHRATSCTPFTLMITYPPPHLSLTRADAVDHTDLTVRMVKQRFLKRLKNLMATAKSQLEKAQAKYKENFDDRVKPSAEKYRKNDYVFISREAVATGLSDHKLRSKAIGPFKILRVNPIARYAVVKLDSGQESVVSYDRMAKAPISAKPLSTAETHSKNKDISSEVFKREFPPRPIKPRRSARLAEKALLVPDARALIREAQKPRLFYRKFIKSYDKQRKRYRVRWAGLPPHLDTYEIESQLPYSMVKAYNYAHKIK